MATVPELLSRTVSYQVNAWSPPCNERSVQQVLSDIRYGTYSGQVQHLRDLLSTGERERYGERKRLLPGVTFSAVFKEKRQISEIKEYTKILVLDIDHLSESGLVAATITLREDPHVFACWVSPSQEGLKGLVGLSFSEGCVGMNDADKHRAAFAHVSRYFEEAYGVSLDQSGSDITRLCFLSSDPRLHLRIDAAEFVVAAPEPMGPERSPATGARSRRGSVALEMPLKHLLNRTEGKNLPTDRARMASIITYLTKRGISITATYEKWMRVAFATAEAFTFDVGKRYYLDLCRLDGHAHDERRSIAMLESCYQQGRGEVGFGTILHYAQECGYKKKS